MFSYEYDLIRRHYGDRKAERSQVPLINHIDEGLEILRKIGADLAAMKAFCLHPLCQHDDDLKKVFEDTRFETSSGRALIYVMEYRSVANEYLSKRVVLSLDEIRLSPLKGVNDMLIADKVQNYKDFLQYHSATHPRAAELNHYFLNWLRRLKVPSELFPLPS